MSLLPYVPVSSPSALPSEALLDPFRNVKNGDKNGADSEIRVVIRERLTGRSWLNFVAHRHEIP